MDKCETAGCTGHLGKFADCLAEAVWQAAMNGTDESTGSTEYEGHLTLVIFEAPEFIQVDESDVWVLIDEGHYLVLTDSDGGVYVTPHPANLAREIFDGFAARYGAWADVNE